MPLVFTPLLKAAGYLDNLSVTLANVGSRKIDITDDFGHQGWSIFAPNLTIYGFDADADACEAANTLLAEQGINWTEQHLPLALSDTCGTKTLYVTREPMCSSLYPPNELYLKRFHDLPRMMSLDFTIEVETTTLDTFCQEEGVKGIDFLRTDVQGADLDVLRGAQNLLSQSLLVVEVEVIFSPLYVEQPLFADIDTFMRAQGFTLMQLGLNPGVLRKDLPVTASPYYRGQKFWGDAVYIRDLLAPETPEHWRTPENIFKLACMMDVLNYHDYTAELLLHLIDVHHWPLEELVLYAVRNCAPENLLSHLPIVDYLQQKIKMCCDESPVQEIFTLTPSAYTAFLSREEHGHQVATTVELMQWIELLYKKALSSTDFEKYIVMFLKRGNLPQAEVLLRHALAVYPTHPKIFDWLGQIACAVNLPHFATQYFTEAIQRAPNWDVPRIHLAQVHQILQSQSTVDASGANPSAQTNKFLLIKAWGYGFWADVFHVLGQLLIAELTRRIPVVHWGANSLYGNGTNMNAFKLYFEDLNDFCITDLLREDFDFWPPKWNHQNLMEAEINKWTGSFSRIAGLYLLNRSERVVVSDFFTGVIDLIPWIPASHPLHGLSVDDIYRHLVNQYLKPRSEILDEIENFYTNHLESSPNYIAVHIRGSDKIKEMKGKLHDINQSYQDIINQYLSRYSCDKIFLMTDDSDILNDFLEIYGNQIVATNCQRTSGVRGLHYQDTVNRYRLGVEVMIDTYLAAKAKAFVGSGFSNPSLMVNYLKNWSTEYIHLVGENIHRRLCVALHNW